MSSYKAFVLFSLLTWCSAYNIDVKTTNAVVKQGFSDNSLFGYSLTLHAGTHFSGKPTIFVGAPLGDEHGIDRGDLIECPIADANCNAIKLDSTADIEDYEYREKQWFGASVFSNGDGPVITCAPRYSEKDDVPGNYKYFMIGKCRIYRESNGLDNTMYPCTVKAKGHTHKTRDTNGFCQAGFSSTIRSVSKTAVIGAVGGKREKGMVVLQNRPKETQFTQSPDDHLSGAFYFGYAVTSGNFYRKESSDEDIAASVPRIEFTGKVNVYTPGLKFRETIFPPEIVVKKKEHIYFGASICAVDVNADGFADLIVGAPFYSDKSGDEGRVYVYLSSLISGRRVFTLAPSEQSSDPGLRGSNSPGARFGWAIAKAGDLNFDGYDDFIVGAPQDLPDLDDDGLGNGAVYIYHGNKNYKMDGYKQKITAEKVKRFYNAGFRQFGYAVTGNVDTNDDEYPDIAIGAWDSDRVLLLRTRPVMYVKANLILSRREIPVDNFTANCPDKSGKQCLDAEVHFSYYGKSVTGNQTLSYTFVMDKEKSSEAYKRVYLGAVKKEYKSEGEVVLTGKNVTAVVKFSPIYVKEGNRLTEDLSSGGSDIVFDLEYELVSPPECENTILCPVLDESQPNVLSEKAELVFNCSDNRCDHDLKIDIRFDKDDIVIGKTDVLIATVVLSNKDEISYNPEVTITHPASLQYEKFTLIDESFRIIRGDVDAESATTVEKFRLQGPLGRNQEVSFTLQYSTKNVGSQKKELCINATVVGQSGEEKNEKDNNDTDCVSVKREVFMEITGISRPKLLNYPSSAPALNIQDKNATFNISDIGPSVKVTFELENKGASDLQSITFTITYPLTKRGGNPQDYIVYPISIEEQGDGSCNKDGVLDPENLGLAASDDKKRRKRAIKVLSPRTATRQNLECTINELKSGERFIVAFELRLWIRSLVEFYSQDIVVKVEANAEYDDNLSTDKDKKKKAFGSVDIHVSPENAPGKSKSTPVWVIIVSVLGGVLLLALAILALFKLGFFKRTRPPKDISSPQTDDVPPVA